MANACAVRAASSQFYVTHSCGRRRHHQLLCADQHHDDHDASYDGGRRRNGTPAATAYLPLKNLVADDHKPGVRVLLAAQLKSSEDEEDDDDTATARRVVVKIFDLSENHIAVNAHNELRLMQLATSMGQRKDEESHVIRVLEALEDDQYLYVVMPYLNAGDLFDVVDRRGALPRHEAQRYFVHVCKGIGHLKQCGIAHGDVSLENIMLTTTTTTPEATHASSVYDSPLKDHCLHRHYSDDDDDDESTPFFITATTTAPTKHNNNNHNSQERGDGGYSAYLIDLGSACAVRDDGMCPVEEYRYRGKTGYVPPELVVGDDTQPVDVLAIDIWALGICLYMMLTARPLYNNPDDEFFDVLVEGRAEELLAYYTSCGLSIDPLAHELVLWMLNADPRDRPTIEQVMAHPWCRSL